MKKLLDANVCARYLNGKAPQLRVRLLAHPWDELFVSLPFNDAAAARFGNIRAHLERVGTPIGPLDLQIAAIALANDLILVTHNTKEFSRVPGLMLEDWEI